MIFGYMPHKKRFSKFTSGPYRPIVHGTVLNIWAVAIICAGLANIPEDEDIFHLYRSLPAFIHVTIIRSSGVD